MSYNLNTFLAASPATAFNGDPTPVSSTNPLPVTSSATTPIVTAGSGYFVTASKTRPADTNAYAIGDVINESASAGTNWTFSSIGPSGGKILITYVALEIDLAAVISGMASFRVHLFDAAPTAINDNAAFSVATGDRTKYLGYLEVSTPEDLGATLWVQNDTVRLPVKLASASTSLYGMLETRAAYTPSSGDVFTVHIRAIRIE